MYPATMFAFLDLLLLSVQPQLDGWLGARAFACSDALKAGSMTKKEYQEHGSAFYKEHMFSNRIERLEK